MSDLIQLLPDSVANQIAAGEVIQRPASVIKELTENSIDSGATNIKIVIKDAGKTLIQVIDNGCGMSDTDARLSFERHATSKIKNANDLFQIQTMGFRGEALASIAAIAHVQLRTKRFEDEIGTLIEIEGSEVKNQESVSCAAGTNFQIKNLFYNVPARRKFLKSTSTEMRYIYDEFKRMALANPDIAFSLFHNDENIYKLPSSNLRQRIVNVFGKQTNKSLISLDVETSIVKISGFIVNPEFLKKSKSDQFFFVNKRFMKHPYFYHAVLKSYEKLLPPETKPSFFISLSINPEDIDINIHPTKTEIKFADEKSIWQLLQVGIKETLGKFNIVPSLDFNNESFVDMPLHSKNDDISIPTIEVNPQYNPFEQTKSTASISATGSTFTKKTNSDLDVDNFQNWDKLYSDIGTSNIEPVKHTEARQGELEIFDSIAENSSVFFQFKNKYIITPVKSGLMLVNQKRAHQRILFEQYTAIAKNKKSVVQKILFPETIDLSDEDSVVLKEIIEDINSLGFDISEFGKNTFVINGTPPDMDKQSPVVIIENILADYKNDYEDFKLKNSEKIALSLAKSYTLNNKRPLTIEEMQDIINRLFLCKIPNHTAEGKAIISIIKMDEIEKRFN